jgi:cytochrome c oxidase subunit 2
MGPDFAPAGVDAIALSRFAWLLCGAAALVFLFVMAVLGGALRRGGKRLRWRRWLGVAVLAPGVALAALFGYATWGGVPYHTAAGGQSARMPAGALVIRVTAHMWWWQVRYPGPDGGVVLANEVHLPAGRTVWLALDSADVIHTFWVPALAGKVDMLPGKIHHLPLTAVRPGAWHGQCAEYCGLQHARMALRVVAHTEHDFDSWLARQALPAVADGGRHAAARALFAERCAACHVVRGAGAGLAGLTARLGQPGRDGPVGPDLTHVASRKALGAGALANGPGALAAWLAAPHRYKEGIRMPDPQLAAGDLDALAAWLETLE